MGDEFHDDALLAASVPSDFSAAMLCLAASCPQGARACGRMLPVVTLAQVYAIVNNRTIVDRSVEEQRSEGTLLVLQLPAALRDEPLVVRTVDFEAAMRADAAAERGDRK